MILRRRPDSQTKNANHSLSPHTHSYENRGECFFLPFTKDDLDDQTSQLKSKDKVTFYIAKDNSGTLRARHICLQDPHISPQRYQGIICTLKDSFGFIERADVTREIFFHSSECMNFKQLSLADNVEFSIQTRNNKQVAVNIEKLPEGSVVFEDVDSEVFTGQILEAVERGLSHLHLRSNLTSAASGLLSNGSSSSSGSIAWNKNGKELEIPFSERDLKGQFTLNVGDYVQFRIATDRRDNKKHATDIRFLEETFSLSGEKREKGYVILMEDGFGFIKCFANKDANRVLFKYNELIDGHQKVNLNDEVEFTLTNDPENSLHATRIKLLHGGSTLKIYGEEAKNDVQTKRETGFIVQLKSNHGLIRCLNKKGDVVSFKYDPNQLFSLNDEVEFYVNASPNGVGGVAVGVRKVPTGTIMKNIIAENQINEDLFNTFNMLCRNNQINDNQLSQLSQFKQYGLLEHGSNSRELNSFGAFNDKLSMNNINSNLNNLNSHLGNNLNNLTGSGLVGSSLNNLNSLTSINHLNNQFVEFTTEDKEPSNCSRDLFGNLPTLDKIEQSNHLNHSDHFLNNSYLEFIQQQNSNSDLLLKSSSHSVDSPKPWERVQNNNNHNNNGNGLRSKGFIIALKEGGFGFIENEDHQFEIFFHFRWVSNGLHSTSF